FLQRGPRRGARLDGLRHRTTPGALGNAQSQPVTWIRLGCDPFHPPGAGASFGGMDCLVVSWHGCLANDHDLALYACRERPLLCDAIPCDDQLMLAALPHSWLSLWSTGFRPHYFKLCDYDVWCAAIPA